MEQLIENLRRLGTARLVAMAGVGIGLIAFFVFLAARLTTSEMTVLYDDLSAEEAGEITDALDERNIDYQLQNNGQRVLVPSDRADDVRIDLAQEGLPSDGIIGYEVFDNGDSLATSDFMRNINRVRALEGEMARSLRAVEGVEHARVHIVMADRQMFQRQRQEPSASVFLRLSSAGALTPENANAMQRMVAGGIPELTPENVTIVDEQGSMLAGSGEDGSPLQDTPQEIQAQYEDRIARSIERLLGQTLGPQAVRAEVSAEMNFDQVTETIEEFDPNQQVARSEQTVTEEESRQERDAVDAVTVAENLPDAEAAAEGNTPQVQEESSREEETVNYEVGRVMREVVREPGTVERLSVGVIVDGTREVGPNGEETWEPRSDEEMQQIEDLVQSAVGYQEDRGDRVEVVNMRFADPFLDQPLEEPVLFGLTQEELFRIAETLVLAIVAVLVILLVVRPLIARAFETPVEAEEAEGGAEAVEGEGAPQMLEGPTGATPADLAPGEEEEDEELIDIARVEGQVRASSMRKVGELVEKHPEEAVSILRNWMYQEQA